jgi:hypothetical protein
MVEVVKHLESASGTVDDLRARKKKEEKSQAVLQNQNVKYMITEKIFTLEIRMD